MKAKRLAKIERFSMTKIRWMLLFILVLLFCWARLVEATLIYSNDFESEAGSEWSSTNIDTTPVGERSFLGQFGYETVTLTLNDLPSHPGITVSFDVFVINSWDGNNTTWGPDVWDLSVIDGPTLLHTTFSNIKENPSNFPQSYPDDYPGGNYLPCFGATEVDTLGYEFYGLLKDSVYHLGYTFSHSESSLQLSFSAFGLEELSDESWGLDNVEVHAVPVPATIFLFGSGILGMLGCRAWHRRKKSV